MISVVKTVIMTQRNGHERLKENRSNINGVSFPARCNILQNCSDYKSSVIVNERGTPPCCNRQKFLFLFQDAASHVEGLPRTKLIWHVVPTPLLTTNCSPIQRSFWFEFILLSSIIRVNTFILSYFSITTYIYSYEFMSERVLSF